MQRRHLIVTTLILAAYTPPASAQDSPERAQLDLRSRQVGLGRPAVAALKRADGPGRTAVAKLLLSRFAQERTSITTAGDYRLEHSGDTDRYTGAGWYLSVTGDGSRCRYRNYGRLEHLISTDPAHNAPDLKTMEQWGRSFLKNKLWDLTATDPDQAIIPLTARYQKQGALSVGGSRFERTVAATIVFGRRWGGTDILGEGSKLSVLFASNGEVIGFDLDWPKYLATSEVQSALPLAGIMARLIALEARAPSLTNPRTTRFECGYIDHGSGRTTTLQAGCFVQYIELRKARDLTIGAGRLVALPIGQVFYRDEQWIQTVALCAMGQVLAGARCDVP
jgi:hypothetical protein